MPKEAKPKRAAAVKAEKSGRTTKAKAKKDPNAPKRARSAFLFFSAEWRDRIKVENPDAKFGELGKLLGSKWNEIEEKDKTPYVKMAQEDKKRYEKEKADYELKGTTGSGSAPPEDDD